MNKHKFETRYSGGCGSIIPEYSNRTRDIDTRFMNYLIERKRVFAMDLFVKDSINAGLTIDTFEEDIGWAEDCDGQLATQLYDDTENIWECIGLDGIPYHIFKSWTRLVES